MLAPGPDDVPHTLVVYRRLDHQGPYESVVHAPTLEQAIKIRSGWNSTYYVHEAETRERKMNNLLLGEQEKWQSQ